MSGNGTKNIAEVTSSKPTVKMLLLIDSEGNKLTATAHHPIFTQENGFIQLASVKMGQTLKTVKGFSKVISNIEVPYSGNVFNLNIDSKNISNDSFYASNILVGGVNMQKSLDK